MISFLDKTTQAEFLTVQMLLLWQVIFETLRIATVVNGVLRKTTQDVEMKGRQCSKDEKSF